MAKKFDSGWRKKSVWDGKFFTLIELLIVIAIIAILAAMLLPALNKARDSAKNIDCIARTKQLMLAMTSYTDDNGNFLPYISGNGAGDSSQLAYSGGTIPNLLGKYLAAQSNESREKKAAVWECPRLPYTRTNGVNRDFFCGKWLNGCLFTDRSGTRGRKLVNIKTPSAKILFMDTLDTVTGPHRCAPARKRCRFYRRPRGGDPSALLDERYDDEREPHCFQRSRGVPARCLRKYSSVNDEKKGCNR